MSDIVDIIPTSQQREAIHRILDRGRVLVWAPPGAGKTVVATKAIMRAVSLRPDGQCAPYVLVVTPALGGAALRHWQRHLEATIFSEPILVTGPKAVRQGHWRDVMQWPSGPYQPVVVVATYDTLRTDLEEAHRIPWDILVVDEAHRCKDRKAKQTRAVQKLANRADRVWLLTGTPVVNRPDELWSLLHILDRKRWSSYWRWVDQWCLTEELRTGYSPYPIRKVVSLRPPVQDTSLRLLADMDQHLVWFPSPHTDQARTVTIEVDLTREERQLYDHLLRHFWIPSSEEDTLWVWSKGALTTRLRQFTSEWSSLTNAEKPGTKITVTLDLLNDLNEPAILMTAFRRTAELLVEQLGSRAALWTGDVTSAERMQILQDFRAEKVDYIVGTLGALGEGIDGLQHRARIIVFVDLAWSPALNEQAIGRLLRTGQTRQVVAYHIVAKGTIDNLVIEALLTKRDVVSVIRSSLADPPKAVSPTEKVRHWSLQDQIWGTPETQQTVRQLLLRPARPPSNPDAGPR